MLASMSIIAALWDETSIVMQRLAKLVSPCVQGAEGHRRSAWDRHVDAGVFDPGAVAAKTVPQTRLRVNFDECLCAGPGLELSETLWWTVRYEIRLARWGGDLRSRQPHEGQLLAHWAMQLAAGRHYSSIGDGGSR